MENINKISIFLFWEYANTRTEIFEYGFEECYDRYSAYIIVMSNKLMKAVQEKMKRSNSKSKLKTKSSNHNLSKD